MTTVVKNNDGAVALQKLTETQIEAECPDRLKQIAKEIEVRLKKADKQTDLAQDHLIAVEQLLNEAKELCDEGGYKKFREMFCPQLGKSQAYALLAIAAGRKTLIEHRAEARERQRRSRAKRAALTDEFSVTVTENAESCNQSAAEVVSDPALDVDGTSPGSNEDDGEARPLPTARRHGVSPTDYAMKVFNTATCELIRVTKGKASDRYVGTPIQISDINRLCKYLRDLSRQMQARRTDPLEEASAESVESRPAASMSPPAQDAQLRRNPRLQSAVT